MQQQAETTSPCVGICRLDADTGLCTGCYRSITEITQWRSASEGERRAILARVTLRRTERGVPGGPVLRGDPEPR
ncbi:MAG: DUF1289 domain-containing protein [Rhodospirillales bacterium]